MRRVYKYPIETRDQQILIIPGLIQVLHLDVQGGRPCIWCMVDPDKAAKGYKVIIHGTGHDADDTADMKYVGTYKLFNGTFVGHVFIEQK